MDIDDVPASPSNAELTEAVLLKSQYLLQQLTDLDLDSDNKASICTAADKDVQGEPLDNNASISNAADMDMQSDFSPVTSRLAPLSKLAGGVETVEVPVMFLKMLQESWNDACSPGGSTSCERLRSSPAGFPEEAIKDRPQRRASTSSMTSAVSTSPTAASECGSSDSSTHAPLSDVSGQASTFSTQPVRTKFAATRNSVQVRAVSPHQAILLPRMRSATLTSIVPQMSPYHAAALPAVQTLSVTASLPPGSSVSISVTTSQTQSVHITSR
jgi:hypothetical protein